MSYLNYSLYSKQFDKNYELFRLNIRTLKLFLRLNSYLYYSEVIFSIIKIDLSII